MFCSRCGKPAPAGAAFCPACGTPMGVPAAARPAVPQPAPRPTPRSTAPVVGGSPVAPPTTGAVAADFEAQRRRNRWTALGIGAAALVAAFLGASALGILRLGASSSKPGLRVASKGPASALQMPGRIDPPALQLPGRVDPPALTQGATRKQMPADVEAWLKHLQKCEETKVTISGDQMAEALVLMQKMQALGAGMGLMDPYDQSQGEGGDKSPGDYAKGKVMDFRPRWQGLVDFFNSVPPPEECKPLAADFNRALSEVPGMMGDIGDVLNNVSSDPSKALQEANKLKGGSYGDIDRYFARADQKLSDICAKYDHNKWFNIKADVSGGSPLSMFGNLGGSGGGGLPGMGQ